ncbi:MAG: RyR domain-containing protein [bacterium]
MLDDALIRQVAEQIHEGYVFTNRGTKSSYLVPWSELPQEIQDSNVYAVRDFLTRLEAIGMVPELKASRAALPADIGEADSLLAELGHLSWVHRLKALGWRHTTGARDPILKLHPSLVSWALLPEGERQPEYSLIRQVPMFLDTAGYVIVDAKGFPDSDLSNEMVETLAQALHETYQHQRLQYEETVFDNAAMRPWPRLEDTWKAANRAAAESIGVVLGSVGCTVVPAGARTSDVLAREDWGHCINALAQVWHRQWMVDRRNEGWVFALGPKNLAKRRHPDLVSWGDLADASRDKARAQVQELPAIVARVGLIVSWATPRIGHRTDFNTSA